jgi:hypothetical protein
MVPLSARTREHLRTLFDATEREEAERLLSALDDAAKQAPRTPESLERLRFAALRVSAGTLVGLREALALARTDWRDLLMSAGFGYDVDAHAAWQPRVFNAEVRGAWRRGAAPPDVAFLPQARVRIVDGKFKQQLGTVVDLLGCEPSPRYRVRTDQGKETDAWQGWLRAAGQ